MCNAINYKVIFIDEMHFNVITMMLIYYWIKKIFILLLWCELVLLCHVYNYEFNYLQGI
jgi:hypothetical protein